MLAISLLAAVVTAFFVPPDRDYLGYYDLKTLSCLFSVGSTSIVGVEKKEIVSSGAGSTLGTAFMCGKTGYVF